MTATIAAPPASIRTPASATPPHPSRTRAALTAAVRQPALVAGAALLLLLVVFCFVGPLLRPFGPNEISGLPLAAPDAVHWLGTDDLGRDVFVRLAVGGHSSLAISFFAAALAAIIGTGIGLAAGLWGRWIDGTLMVVVELVLAVPAILLALCAVTIFGGSVPAVIGVLAVAAIPEFARLVRAKCLELRELDFVLSARVSGVGSTRIALRHLLPNTASVITVQFANTAAISILLEASLSYLGLSVQPPTPSWGRMIFDSQTYMTIAPWLAIAPLLAILALSSGWGLIGESLASRRRRIA